MGTVSQIDHEEIVDAGNWASNGAYSKTDCSDTARHKRIREDAAASYLHNANAQLDQYVRRSSKRQRTYVLGDVVGLKASDVDRTNTWSTILPCKIFGVKDHDSETMYQVATVNGIIEGSFPSPLFLDLRSSNFAALRSLVTDALPTITFIQAYQLYTNFRSADTCKCTGDCKTNRCQCKKRGRKCGSKCHAGDGSKCKNC